MEFEFSKQSNKKEKDFTQTKVYDITVRTSANDVLELYDITSPYIILLETCRTEDENVLLYQFAPSTSHLSCLPKSRLDKRPQHQHSFIEIMYVLSGRVTNQIENQSFVYTAGQCCVMNKNIHHRERLSDDFQAVFFMLQDDFLEELRHEYGKKSKNTVEENPIYQLLDKDEKNHSKFDKVYLDYFTQLSPKEILAEMKPLFNMLVLESLSEEPGSLFFLKGAFARLIHHLSLPHLYTMQQVRSDSQSQTYLFGKIEHIMRTSHGRANREELCSQLNYNGEYLNRIVKKYTGKTISKYGQDICLEEARKLLEETDIRISTIITELGFSNRSHFYKLFEKTYGITPLEYRNVHYNKP